MINEIYRIKAHLRVLSQLIESMERDIRVTEEIKIKTTNKWLTPCRANPTDAGADLYSTYDVELMPGEQHLIDTGVAMKIPTGYVGLVFNRSSQGKTGVVIANGTGVIDSSYRGNILVLLRNTGSWIYKIKAADTRIAQIVIVPILLANFSEFTGSNEDWLDTDRGIGGFGSTGGTANQ